MDIPVLNVATVFPQVHGNAVGPGQFRQHRCRHRIGFYGMTGLAQGGNVVNVDSQGRQAIAPKRL
jgi:hypothetical protein